jgi:tetratricopeptide (TPR) repeat protein
MTTAALAALEAQGLVEFVPGPEAMFRFRHPLIADAAYESLLRNERRAIHGAVGDVLVRRASDAHDGLAAELARHFSEAGDADRALEWATRAGDAAYRRYALPEAIMLLGQATALALETGADGALLRRVALAHGRALEIAGRQDEAFAAYVALSGVAEARADRDIELAALLARATLRAGQSSQHDASEGQALAERALTLARELGDRAAEAKALWCHSLSALFRGRVDDTIAFGEASLAIALELGLTEQEAQTRLEIGHAGLMSGRTAVSAAHLSIAADRFRAEGNLAMLSDALASDAFRLFEEGRLEEALARTREALVISEETDNLWGQGFALEVVGYVAMERGELGAAVATWEDGIERATRAGYAGAAVNPGTALAAAYGMLGAADRAFSVAERARSVAEGLDLTLAELTFAVLAWLHLRSGDGEAARAAVARYSEAASTSQVFIGETVFGELTQVELLLADGRADDALGRIDRLLAAVRERGIQIVAPDLLAWRARALVALGRADEAVSDARVAVARAESVGSRRSLWPGLIALAEAERAAGDPAAADAARTRAATLVREIADGIDDSDLRASFLGQAEVAALLAGMAR